VNSATARTGPNRWAASRLRQRPLRWTFGTVTVTLLDGRALAARRAPEIARRAAGVAYHRGRAPTLLLLAFADDAGHAAHVDGKLRACAAAGIDAVLLLIAPGTATAGVSGALAQAIDTSRPDAVFVQIPFPDGIDGDVVAAAIPYDADVDIMSPSRIAQYRRTPGEAPPVTITAATLLLAEHGVSVDGRRGLVVAEPSPFADMFAEELARHGADMSLVDPTSRELEEQVRAAGVVVAAVGRPGMLRSDALAPGAIALDIGYFNEGGRGDIDTAPGVEHLRAIMPVPGGVGPMTVSALLERVVLFAGG
jgi:methylenetetrahydrofolate dehydrogenase (NADP+) / methenyltetrahydrofolate cyclohydrolase